MSDNQSAQTVGVNGAAARTRRSRRRNFWRACATGARSGSMASA